MVTARKEESLVVKKRIFPVTRVHEPLQVDIEIDNGQIVEATITNQLFRGFEPMMIGRDPRDASLFLQRICGICSSAHAMAAAYALEDAYGLVPTQNGELLRNLIFGADFLQNHLRHFYVLSLADYMRGPDYSPFKPKPAGGDYRLPDHIEKKLLEHYWQGLEMSTKCHEMVACFGAKAPHVQTIIATGNIQSPDRDKIITYASLLEEVTSFIENVYLQDVDIICRYYSDYYKIGTGYSNLLNFGLFPEGKERRLYYPPGVVINAGEPRELDQAAITEDITYSWYKDGAAQHPYQGKTVPDREKPLAYTWNKAARYQGIPMETGPLARLWVKGTYRNGISTMDRIMARALETREISKLLARWINEIVPGQPPLSPYEPLPNAKGMGLTGAMRGALGHWVKIEKGVISHYQVITPSVWNFSPRDQKGQRGPAEQALIGAPVEDLDNPLSIGRILRSFDPCFSCAVQVTRAR